MNQYEMVAAIIAIIFVAKMVRDANRMKYAERAAAPPTAETDALIAEVARLRDRVEVLERIATDRGGRLSDEIEQLRRLDDATVR